jgi:hypothetical protein
MAISVQNVEYQKAEYLWRETEARLAESLRAGMTAEQAEVQRQAMWEKMQYQFGNLERFGQQIPRVPDPGSLLKQELEKQKYEKLQTAKQQEAMRKARVEYMQSAAMACSITDGLNLWAARWGDGWVLVVDVQRASVETDAFRWDLLQTRLTRTHRLETDGEYVRVVT